MSHAGVPSRCAQPPSALHATHVFVLTSQRDASALVQCASRSHSTHACSTHAGRVPPQSVSLRHSTHSPAPLTSPATISPECPTAASPAVTACTSTQYGASAPHPRLVPSSHGTHSCSRHAPLSSSLTYGHAQCSSLSHSTHRGSTSNVPSAPRAPLPKHHGLSPSHPSSVAGEQTSSSSSLLVLSGGDDVAVSLVSLIPPLPALPASLADTGGDAAPSPDVKEPSVLSLRLALGVTAASRP